ncbi:bestrophin-4-like isoform X2 [Sitophilus oryzae]|uniref:Bestrophin homolog n=1 Tax=Sitophilus oryzae TaxID=7048 RepID=A0A6J2X3F9_SITOR|nr:bestrophin-4-like isoform X2 [Sitophilus oryzae]
MTVTYTGEVATCRGLGCFLKLLARWRGSIYKLVWIDLIVFLLIYYGLNLTYRLLLDETGKALFETIVKYCYDYGSLIPLSFVLGFYVSVVMTRWWNQYTTIPFPDPLAVFVSATVHGQDERGRVMRRTIMRYVCLSVTMTFTMIAPRVKKRFPTLDHFVEAGLLHESEKDIMLDLNKKFPKYSKHWLPIVWASSIITRARKEGRIRDDFAVKTLIDELNKFRGQCGLLLSYDTISVPLVYTQVVTLAVYSYFLTTLMGHQWVGDSRYRFDLYFPVFTTLQFFFYVGWLKVAESLINPFGDDDDDFEVNWMVDRNLQVSYLIVDEMHHDHPELVRDQYWDQVFPQELPYTPAAAAAESMRNTHPLPSTANIAVKPEEQELMSSSLKLDPTYIGDNMQGGPITFSANKQPSFKSRKNSSSSLAMGASVPDSIPRVASVVSLTNKLKRFFSRDESKADSRGENNIEAGQEMNNLILSDEKKFGTSTKDIKHEIIEEVDEQNTITSQKQGDKDGRPTVMEIFGPPPSSKPIDVPQSSSYANHFSNTDVYEPYPPISRSAPSGDGVDDATDNVSIGSETDDEDEFEMLKKQRDEERLSRLKNMARSLSIQKDEDPERQLLLRRQTSVYTSSPPLTPL